MFCKLWLNIHLLLVQHQDDAPTQHHLKMLSIDAGSLQQAILNSKFHQEAVVNRFKILCLYIPHL